MPDEATQPAAAAAQSTDDTIPAPPTASAAPALAPKLSTLSRGELEKRVALMQPPEE
jgi:uncharacterized small protein (DUF1192 family)